VFDLPDKLPAIAVAAGGKNAAELAATHGSGLFATEPRPDLVETFTEAGGSGPKYAELAVAWAPDEADAVRAAHETSRWSVLGWKVMSELPNPANFEAASATVRPDDVRDQLVTGPDPQRYRDAIGKYEKAGFDHIALMNTGPDPDGFLTFCERELIGQLDG
jgi:G6PDH family F420-dependent oxidoreductase